MPAHALLVSTDLVALSSTEGAATRAGVTLQTVGPKAAVAAARTTRPKVVAIDLTTATEDLATLVTELREAAHGVSVIAYGPHVHEAKLESARTAGCDLVMSRGQFHRGAGELLARYSDDES